MKNILIHGLGQTNNSWNDVNNFLKQNGFETITPNLFEIIKDSPKNYRMMYNAFSSLCNNQNEKLNLCGLSLGGILALDFTKEYSEKVNSIILIGTPYKIPKLLFKFQNVIFHLMPKRTFTKMGCSKREFIAFVNSMSNLNIADCLNNINCQTLIICGMKDKANIKSAKLLKQNIRNSKFKIISNSGHEVNVENPKELANVIYNFWKDIRED